MTEFAGVSDAHAHLDPFQFPEGLDEVIANAKTAGLKWIINVAMLRDGAEEALAITQNNQDFMRAIVGCHPHDAKHWGPAMAARLNELAARPQVVGLGEMGLDFYRNNSPEAEQKAAFAQQLDIAAELELPIIIHDRQAHDQCLDLVRAHGRLGADDIGMFHCFSGDVALAKEVLDLGFIISIPGVVTFPKAKETQEVAAFCPLDRLVVETDCPFLAPVPFRGKRNEPAYVVETAKKVAELKGLPYPELARATTANLERLFKLPGGGHA